MGPAELAEILDSLDFTSDDKNLLVGLEGGDDAIVYRLNSKQALIQTVDFFTPIVDDPYLFGQISAANSLSDVYAMGGEPFLAMNIVCFPDSLDKKILRDILQGGLDKAREAGIIISGGHTIDDEEPKYGLSVSGLIHPDRVVPNSGARAGDKLILTKPLGTGIITTAFKAGQLEQSPEHPAIKSMLQLNSRAASLFERYSVSACTDITGFGLAGHLLEMLKASGRGSRIQADNLPYFAEVPELSAEGMVPGGLYRNREAFSDQVKFTGISQEFIKDLIFDPQTSGGLLISLPEEEAQDFLREFNDEEHQGYPIGVVVEGDSIVLE